MFKKILYKYSPQKCCICGHTENIEDTSQDVWTCDICGTTSKYSLRKKSKSSHANARCLHCGCEIPIGSRLCPICGAIVEINDTKIQVTGNKASEVLEVLKGYVEAIDPQISKKGDNYKNEADLRWERFTANARDTGKEFEQLCKELFRREYFDEGTVFKSIRNNPGVEIHPLRASKGEFSGKLISFQSKFYTGNVNYSDIKNSMEKMLKYYCVPSAHEKPIDVVVLYCNLLISQSDNTGTLLANKTFITTEEILKSVDVTLRVICADELLERVRKYPELVERYFST